MIVEGAGRVFDGIAIIDSVLQHMHANLSGWHLRRLMIALTPIVLRDCRHPHGSYFARQARNRSGETLFHVSIDEDLKTQFQCLRWTVTQSREMRAPERLHSELDVQLTLVYFT